MNGQPTRQLIFLIWIILLTILFALPADSAVTPRIFFSDLESGPHSGGQDDGGAFVSIYGSGFGESRGTSSVRIGSGAAARYPIWTDTRITVQLGRAAATGEIVVITPRGTSNGVPFTVRAGNIYFVAVNGNDGSNGSFTSPWRTLLKARDTLQPGDVAYAMNGVSQTTDDGQGWSAAMMLRTGGLPGRPKALVAYPGATVTIGNIAAPPHGIRSTDFSAGGGACPGHWVFAGITFRGSGAMTLAGPSSGWRIVANDFSCPNGDGAGACFDTSQASDVHFLGNKVHHAGKAGASALYHGVYFSTDSNHIDAGWNTIEYVRGCRGLQVHSSPVIAGTGFNQYDIAIHDNTIHDTQCDGIILATVDPSKGKVEVYNNVIYNAGQGPNNPERSGHWACILAAGTTNSGAPGGGVVEVYNNTLHSCGTFATPPYASSRSAVANGGHNQNLRIRMRNNIIYQTAGVSYLEVWGPSGLCSTSSNCAGIGGSNNLFFGSGPAPQNGNLTRSLSSDPLFVNSELPDFHLRANSPARGAGVDTGSDLGALPYADASPQPNL